MFVEVFDDKNKIPALVDLSQARPAQSLMGKVVPDKTTVNSFSVGNAINNYDINLPYEVFRWAFISALNDQEQFLDLKPQALEKIKADYAQQHPQGPHDPHATHGSPHRYDSLAPHEG